MNLLEVEGLSKSFVTKRDALGRTTESNLAVNNVSFALGAGMTLALVGESGAGKSTTARLVLRLIEPDAGSIIFDGVNLRDLDRNRLRAFRRHMQMIFQDPYSSLDPRIPIGESIAEPLRIFEKQLSAASRMERACALLERVGLAAKDRKKFPNQLSGGQLQRVAIARALVLNARLIVCDEPVAALDMSVRAQVLNLIDDLQHEYSLAVLFITHDLSLVKVLADQVAVMQMGAIIEYGKTAAIFESPKTEYTRTLLDAIPTVGGRAGRPQNLSQCSGGR